MESVNEAIAEDMSLSVEELASKYDNPSEGLDVVPIENINAVSTGLMNLALWALVKEHYKKYPNNAYVNFYRNKFTEYLENQPQL